MKRLHAVFLLHLSLCSEKGVWLGLLSSQESTVPDLELGLVKPSEMVRGAFLSQELLFVRLRFHCFSCGHSLLESPA